MPPQKRSIRDFFAPQQKGAQTSQTATKQPALKVPPALQAPSTASEIQRVAIAPDSSPISLSITEKNAARTPASENVPPSTSQSSGNSTGVSKRVVSNGESVVLNSDSDSDGLPEFDFGVPTTKAKVIASTTRTQARDRFSKDGLREPPPKRKEESSLSFFVRMAEEGAELERKIMEGKAELDKPLKEAMLSVDSSITEEALADAVYDEENPEKGKRLCLAMQRTNALRSEYVFHFFKEHWEDNVPRDSPIPIESLPNESWTTCFREQSTSEQAFLSGFADKIFCYQQLPDELASWMIDQVCFGQNGVLSEKYIQILSGNHCPLKTLLDKPRLESLFTSLGADSQCLNPLRETMPSYEPHPAPQRVVPSSLIWVCKLLQRAAPRLQMEANSYTFHVLLHLSMDHSVNSNVDILHAVQDTVEAIMCSMSDSRKLASLLNDVVPQLLTRIRQPVLQRRLVVSLPAKTPLAAYFQRHLALSFLLHPKILDISLDHPNVPTLVHAYLESSPDFRITKATNYMSLSAHLTLLDIAVGPGPFIVPYYPLISPVTSPEGSSPIIAPGPQSSEEKAFNIEVDALVQRIKLLSNSIVETGVLSDLWRLEAKDCSERLYHRLESAVRIGGKKLVDIFGDSEQVTGTKKMYEWMGFKSKPHSERYDANGTGVDANTDAAMEA